MASEERFGEISLEQCNHLARCNVLNSPPVSVHPGDPSGRKRWEAPWVEGSVNCEKIL